MQTDARASEQRQPEREGEQKTGNCWRRFMMPQSSLFFGRGSSGAYWFSVGTLSDNTCTILLTERDADLEHFHSQKSPFQLHSHSAIIQIEIVIVRQAITTSCKRIIEFVSARMVSLELNSMSITSSYKSH